MLLHMIPESHRNTDTPFWLYLPAGIIQKMGVPRGRPNGVTVQMALKIFYFLFHRQNDGASSLPHSLFSAYLVEYLYHIRGKETLYLWVVIMKRACIAS